MKGFVKDPNAVLDYTVDWSQWLSTDTIDSSSWIIESPLAAVPASEFFDDTTTRIFITGGDVDQDYLVTNRIVTAGGRTDDRSFEIRVRNR